MNAPKNLRIAKAKQKLAAGILAQARRDLRKFRDRATAVERELYRDAYTWVTADNCRWPFSFLNVCRLLDLDPEELRHDLLQGVSLGVCRYWSRRCGRVLRQCQSSLCQAFSQPTLRPAVAAGSLTPQLA